MFSKTMKKQDALNDKRGKRREGKSKEAVLFRYKRFMDRLLAAQVIKKHFIEKY